MEMEKKKMRMRTQYLVIWAGQNVHGRLVFDIVSCTCAMGRSSGKNKKHQPDCKLLEHLTAVYIPIRKGETVSDVAEMLSKLIHSTFDSRTEK